MVKNQADVVSTLLDKGGYLYVCGDAKNMAKNVREKLIVAIQNLKGK
jgi:sulfite reductase alpha subunit-like flavoprotein